MLDNIERTDPTMTVVYTSFYVTKFMEYMKNGYRIPRLDILEFPEKKKENNE